MGMFDYVDYTCKCPICGTLVNNFQSKDGDCNLEVIQLDQVRRFYAFCPNIECDQWIEFKNKKEEFVLISPSKKEMDIINSIISISDAINQSKNKYESVATHCKFFLKNRINTSKKRNLSD